MLGYFSNCNIIKFSNEETSFEDIYKINQVLLDGNSDNMDSLIQTGKYGAINKTYTTTMG